MGLPPIVIYGPPNRGSTMAEEGISPTWLKRLYAGCLLTGVIFYFTWGLVFNAFFDYANYTISAALVFTGLFGTFLYRELEREKAKAARQ